MKIMKIERTLKALANRRRLAIIQCLKKRKEATVGQISQDIKLSFTATSKHLAVLHAADIVVREQRSLEMWYRVSPEINHIAKYISNSIE